MYLPKQAPAVHRNRNRFAAAPAAGRVRPAFLQMLLPILSSLL